MSRHCTHATEAQNPRPYLIREPSRVVRHPAAMPPVLHRRLYLHLPRNRRRESGEPFQRH